MRAFALTAPDQPAALVGLPDPQLDDGGILVRVRAASVNGFDVFQASGALASMMPHDFPTIVGRDFAGVVEAVAPGRTDINVGDEVLGFVPATPPLKVGTYAELVGGAGLVVVRKPAEVSFAVAAALPLAAVTALDAVAAVDPGPGDAVLIMGATGGVGAFAVQLAAQRGARVIASAKPGEDDAFVRSLGASETIDYTKSGLGDSVRALTPGGLAGLIDVVSGGEAFMALAALVQVGGRASTTLGAADVESLQARSVRATNVMGSPTPGKLAGLADQVAAGTLRVEVQGVFPLADVGVALAAFQAGTRGKLVLEV